MGDITEYIDGRCLYGMMTVEEQALYKDSINECERLHMIIEKIRKNIGKEADFYRENRFDGTRNGLCIALDIIEKCIYEK